MSYDEWKSRQPDPSYGNAVPRTEPVMRCHCGHGGREFFRTGVISHKVVCDTCGRREERAYLLMREMGRGAA